MATSDTTSHPLPAPTSGHWSGAGTRNKLSPFGEAALRLDEEFSQLEEVGGQISRISIESSSGLERSLELLVQFSARGQGVAETIQVMAKALGEARERAEKVAQNVADRALEIQRRKEQSDQMAARFQALGEKVRTLNTAISGLKTTDQLPEIETELGHMMEEAMQIKTDARAVKLRAVEKDADSLGQSLASAQRKVAALSTRH